MLSRVARRLPAGLKNRLYPLVTVAHRPIAEARYPTPSPLTVEGLLELLKAQDSLDEATDGATIDDEFMRVSLRPELFRALDLDYVRRASADSVAYRRLCAARLLGLGRTEDAFRVLDEIARCTGTLFDFMMAARCLMRPAGSERALLEYLRAKTSRFGDEPLFFLNLATCHFVLGETDAANEILHRQKGKWELILGVETDPARALDDELATALADRSVLRQIHYDETIYDESAIWTHWEPYYTDMNLDPPTLMFGWLRAAYERYMEELVVESGAPALVDFGVMCAQPHHDLGRRRPDLTILGVDRQKSTAELNRRAFSDSNNLEFFAGEIEAFLSSARDLEGAALFHARTATLLYPEKVRTLYRLAHAAGITSIALFENLAFSRGTKRFSDFGDFGADSITFKNFQFIHDYPSLLAEAGYEVVRETRLFSPLVSVFSTEDICSTHVHLVATRRT